MITSKRGKEMLKYLPWYYEKSRIMQLGVLEPQGYELDNLRQTLEEILAQNFVPTSTWGLRHWEDELGIVPLPDDTIEMRRRRVIAQLSWQATSTKAFMEDLINRYTNLKSGRIVEHTDQYTFNTLFDMDDIVDFRGMHKAVELYKPAHLAHVNSLSVQYSAEPVLDSEIEMHCSALFNYWQNQTGNRWDGSRKWNRTIQWGSSTNKYQQHQFFMNWSYGGSKVFTEVQQNWNNGFKWNGTRKWGRFSASDPVCNVSASYSKIVNGIEVGRGSL